MRRRKQSLKMALAPLVLWFVAAAAAGDTWKATLAPSGSEPINVYIMEFNSQEDRMGRSWNWTGPDGET